MQPQEVIFRTLTGAIEASARFISGLPHQGLCRIGAATGHGAIARNEESKEELEMRHREKI